MTLHKRKLVYLATLLIFLQCLIVVFFGVQKRSFFCDEIFSYSLANSQDITFLEYDSVHQYNPDGWLDHNFFRNYVEVNNGEELNFHAAIVNQERDVHPPLYYILLHMVCALFPNTFSKWTGIGLNLCLLLIANCLMYYFAKEAVGKRISVGAIAVWSLSAAGLSNILFIRMYMLQTVEFLAMAAILTWTVNTRNDHSLKHRICVYMLLYLNVITGGLTHYYYYVFLFFTAIALEIVLILLRKFKSVVAVAAVLIGGGVTNLLIFPSTIDQIFHGYRGTQDLKNMAGGRTGVFSSYVSYINKSMFGGLLLLLAVLAIISLVIRFIRQRWQIKVVSDNNAGNIQINLSRNTYKKNTEVIQLNYTWISLVIATIGCIGFCIVAIRGSEIVTNRYIYGCYPFLAVWAVFIIDKLMRNIFLNTQKAGIIATAILCSVMCVMSYFTYGIDYQYKDYDAVEAANKPYAGYDLLIYYPSWWDVYSQLPLKFEYDETYFINDADIDNLSNILQRRHTPDDGLVVHLSSLLTEEEKTAAMDKITQQCGYTSYDQIYSYEYTTAYVLKK